MEYTIKNDISLNIRTVNNFELFTMMSEFKIIKPKVPKFYLEQRDIFIENPDNPKYREALQIYEYEKAIKSLDAALLLSIEKDTNILENEKRKIRNKNVTDENKIWLNYLYSILSVDDISNILTISFLTENQIYDIFNALVMSIYRGGQEILNARLKNAINSTIALDNITINGIQLVHPLDEYTACIESNIDWIKWQQLNNEDKAQIIALFRIKRIVDNHSQDEMAIEMDRKNKN